MSALDDLIEDLQDWVTVAVTKTGDAQGEVSEPDLTPLTEALAESLPILEAINQHADLNGYTGGILSSYQPQTTQQCALDCQNLRNSLDADNTNKTSGWQGRVKKKADTIADIIVRNAGWQQLAGIT